MMKRTGDNGRAILKISFAAYIPPGHMQTTQNMLDTRERSARHAREGDLS